MLLHSTSMWQCSAYKHPTKKNKAYHHLREIKTCDMQSIAVFGCCSGKMPLKKNWLYFDTVYVKKQTNQTKNKKSDWFSGIFRNPKKPSISESSSCEFCLPFELMQIYRWTFWWLRHAFQIHSDEAHLRQHQIQTLVFKGPLYWHVPYDNETNTKTHETLKTGVPIATITWCKWRPPFDLWPMWQILHNATILCNITSVKEIKTTFFYTIFSGKNEHHFSKLKSSKVGSCLLRKPPGFEGWHYFLWVTRSARDWISDYFLLRSKYHQHSCHPLMMRVKWSFQFDGDLIKWAHPPRPKKLGRLFG